LLGVNTRFQSELGEGRRREEGGKEEGREKEKGGTRKGKKREGGKREGRGREEGGKREGRGREEGGKREGGHTNVAISPNPTKQVPIIGKIQWTFASAVQPYQNSPIGIKNAPGTSGGNLYSGFISPFFAMCFNIRSLAIPKINRPPRLPIPIPKNVNPTLPWLKSYWPSKTLLMVVNSR
jgi:hypothetical protein